MLIIPNSGAHFAPVGSVDNEGADRIGSVIKADGIFGAHNLKVRRGCYFLCWLDVQQSLGKRAKEKLKMPCKKWCPGGDSNPKPID